MKNPAAETAGFLTQGIISLYSLANSAASQRGMHSLSVSEIESYAFPIIFWTAMTDYYSSVDFASFIPELSISISRFL